MTTWTPVVFALALALGAVAATPVPIVELRNAAKSGVFMPATGLGTGGYGHYYHNMTEVTEAVTAWLAAGGRRIDASLSYEDQVGVAAGIKASGVPREQIFITSKVGPFLAMGYNETLDQWKQILVTLDTDYIDLLLIHWPGPSENSTDPACVGPKATPKACRQSTWRAVEDIYRGGNVRAIGVSNFEVNHMEDILELKSFVPSVNQFEFHPYWHEDDLVAYCKNLSILVNGYSPLGARDLSPQRCGWDITQDKSIVALAKKHKRSAAEIVLRWEWQQGIVVNPRTKNPQHMQENLSIFNFSLSDEEMTAIRQLKAPTNTSKVCPDPHQIP